MSRIYNGIKSYWAKPETNEKEDEVGELLVIALAIPVDDTQSRSNDFHFGGSFGHFCT